MIHNGNKIIENLLTGVYNLFIPTPIFMWYFISNEKYFIIDEVRQINFYLILTSKVYTWRSFKP